MGHAYHVWFSTKGRKNGFESELGEEMKRLMLDIAKDKGIHIVELELVADHAHLLLEVPDRRDLPRVMHQLKGASARFIFSKYPDLKLDMPTGSFWQKGYGRRWVPRDQLDAVCNYIRTQRDRPYRRAS